MKTITGFFLLASMALAAVQVHAQGKGPRASVASSTQCAVIDGMWIVTTTLTNKSSGPTKAEVLGDEIVPTYKPKNRRGNASYPFPDNVKFPISAPENIDPELMIEAKFDLCDGMGGVLAFVNNARALNVNANVSYGIAGGEGTSRRVTNHCTDNPDTPEYEGGVKVADVIDEIAEDCWLLPTMNTLPVTEVFVPDVQLTSETTTSDAL